ncbi:GGDEF domain-containing protein [Bosea vestrisii]|uniref:GGDEF domain-containing protein n=1 Tax=Bosea vestrisii TaxID=151416 RepID=UPI0024DF58AC|nr:GGDEF domain-containing protein [Bosea vestrisii]WID97124.1 GGDEF domain-containing protein [Bosea vestrisii]
MRAGQRSSTLVCLITALGIWLTFIGLDLTRLDDLATIASGDGSVVIGIALRLGTLAVILRLVWIVRRNRQARSFHHLTMLALALIGVTCAFIANMYKLRGLPQADIAQLVIIAAVFLPVGLTFLQSLGVALLIAMFTAALGFVMLEPLQLAEHGRLSILLFFAVFVSAVGAWLRERAERDQFLLRRMLHSRAMSDALTGIANRRGFEEHVAMALLQARRDRVPVVFAVLDVDHFKRYNDRYGHQAGDIALALIARAVDGTLRRPMDMVGRLGGEEFGLFLYDTTPEKAQERLEQVAQAIAELRIEHAASPTAQYITVSMGAVGFDGKETAVDLYRRADAALYAGKASGRNRVELGESGERLAG